MDPIQLILLAIVLVVVFFYLGWMFNSKIGKKSIASSEERAKQIINDAQKESNNLKREKLLEVKDEWYKKKTEFDNEVQQKRQKVANLEKQLVAREESTEKKFELVLKKERESRQLEKEVQEQKKLIEQKLAESKKLEEELKKHVREKLAGHAYPREFEFVEKLPKTRSGKII